MKRAWAAGVALFVGLAACQADAIGPYAPPSEAQRSTVEAEALNRRAAELIRTEPAEAERLLRAALTKDVFHGPAHNNLGVVCLAQGKLYEAANEFEWARKLLPDSADPRVNLALVLERAGRVDEAFECYEAALEVAPESIGAKQGAARLALRTGRVDGRVARWLDDIALRGEDERWRAWARTRRGGT